MTLGRIDGPSISASVVRYEQSTRGRSELLDRWCELAGQLYRVRRRRDRLFGSIFGEPAWDILLDLFVMEGRGKQVSVSSACIASGTSHSTGLRQIDELVRCRLVIRERDENDKRKTYLRLSDEGLRKLADTLEQLGTAFEKRSRPASPHRRIRLRHRDVHHEG